MKIQLLIIGVALSVFLLNAQAFEKISAEDAFKKATEFLDQAVSL